MQLAFAVAQMAAQQGGELVLIDCLIETKLQTEAVNHPRGPQAYFSQRCHDKGLTCRRIIFLDARQTRTMSTKATGSGILHAHGFALLDPGQIAKQAFDAWYSNRRSVQPAKPQRPQREQAA